mmetsp:Transcript_115524/g.246874  ORF Transcript_115524/g.246874 Transcript_115524/m.246874 type:complete len:234 (+) Transcript_115524:147-848(+)
MNHPISAIPFVIGAATKYRPTCGHILAVGVDDPCKVLLDDDLEALEAIITNGQAVRVYYCPSRIFGRDHRGELPFVEAASHVVSKFLRLALRPGQRPSNDLAPVMSVQVQHDFCLLAFLPMNHPVSAMALLVGTKNYRRPANPRIRGDGVDGPCPVLVEHNLEGLLSMPTYGHTVLVHGCPGIIAVSNHRAECPIVEAATHVVDMLGLIHGDAVPNQFAHGQGVHVDGDSCVQ